MSIIASNNPNPEFPDPSPTKLDKGGYDGTAETLDNKIDDTLAEAELLINNFLIDSTAIGDPTIPIPVDVTGNAHCLGVGPGTYAYWGGLVVPDNNTATLRRVGGVFSVSLTAFDLSGYAKDIDVENSKDGKTSIEQLPLANLIGYIDLYGDIVSDSGWKHSALLQCFFGDTISFKGHGHPSVSTVIFYDKNNIIIAKLSCSSPVDLTIFDAVVPENAINYKICFPIFFTNDSFRLKRNILAKVGALEVETDSLLRVLPKEKNTEIVNYPSKPFSDLTSLGGDLYSVYYINAEAKLTANSNLKNITFKSNGSSVAYIKAVNLVFDGSNYIETALHLYDEITVLNGTNTYNIDDDFILPANSYIAVRCESLYYKDYYGIDTSKSFRSNEGVPIVTYLRISYSFDIYLTKTSEDILTKKQADLLYSTDRSQIVPNLKKKQILTNASKIILYGDSRVSSDYVWLKNSLEATTGAIVNNAGFSGQTAAYLASNAALQVIFNYNPNIIIALLGGNDLGNSGSVGTFTNVNNEPIVTETDINVDYNGTKFIQAVSHIIRKVKKEYYNIRERAALTGTETEVEKTAKIDAVLKPYFIFCTDLKQNRNNALDPWTSVANWKRKRDAIIECCIKYEVHCIDLPNILGWDMTIEPYHSGTTDMVNNKGIYTMDGLHPNKFGYEQITQVLIDNF